MMHYLSVTKALGESQCLKKSKNQNVTAQRKPATHLNINIFIGILYILQ